MTTSPSTFTTGSSSSSERIHISSFGFHPRDLLLSQSNLTRTMGLFQCFQKRSKKDKDIGGKQKGRRTPSNSPASSDDGIVETTKRKPMSPKGHTGMLQSPRGHSSMRKSQLGRISEEPTAVRLAPLKARQEVPPPPAREAAFHGPPRFDWIDIVSNEIRSSGAVNCHCRDATGYVLAHTHTLVWFGLFLRRRHRQRQRFNPSIAATVS